MTSLDFSLSGKVQFLPVCTVTTGSQIALQPIYTYSEAVVYTVAGPYQTVR
jgi:hypothetical protein